MLFPLALHIITCVDNEPQSRDGQKDAGATITSPSGSGTPSSSDDLGLTLASPQPATGGVAGTGSKHPSGVPSGVSRAGTRTSTGAPGSVFGAAPPVNLLNENLLRSTPRIDYHGHQCPSLGGIPLLRKLGQGGMGAVYAGMHPRLHVEVAVKVLPYHLQEKDPALIERFFREAQISAAVHSPHLVNVMDVNEEHGVFFLVMEYVCGKSGKDYLDAVVEGGAVGLSEREVLQLGIAATEGLKDAHSQGVTHRDVKPDNIMIPYKPHTTDLDLTLAKLMDLGLARADQGVINNPALTATKQAMGTPGYMAPEQIMDARTAGPPADIFAMGASLYALLAGQAPFKRKNSMQTLMATLQSPHDPLANVRPDVSPALTAVLEKCLAKAKEERYANGGELLEDLRKCARAMGGKEDGTEAAVRSVGVTPLPGAAPTPTPGSTAAPAPAVPQPKRGALLVGAAAVLVLALAGGGYFALRGGKPAPAAGSVEAFGEMLVNARRAVDRAPDVASDILKDARKFREANGIADAALVKQEAAVGALVAASMDMEKLADSDTAAKLTAGDKTKLLENMGAQLKLAMDNGEAYSPDAEKKDPMAKLCRFVVQERVEAAKEAMGKGAPGLADAQKHCLAAAAVIPDHLGLKALRESLVTERFKAGEQALAKYDFDAAKQQLDAVKELDPKNAQIGKFDEKLFEQSTNRSKFDRWVKDVKAKLAQDHPDLTLIEKPIAHARKLYPDDPALDPLSQSYAKLLLDAAEKDLGKEEFDAAEKGIAAAKAFAPKDARIATLDGKLSDVRSKRENFRKLVVAIQDDLGRPDSDVAAIEKKIGDADAMYANHEDVKTLRRLLEQKKQNIDIAQQIKKEGEFKDALDKADTAIRAGKFDEGEQLIGDAAKVLPDDARLALARSRLGEKREQARMENERRAKRQTWEDGLKGIDGILAASEKALGKKAFDDADTQLADAENRLAAAEQAYPNDAESAPRRAQFDGLKEKVKREKFSALVESVDKALAAKLPDPVTADVEKSAADAGTQLEAAAKLYPTDTKLKALQDGLSKRVGQIKDLKVKREKFAGLVKQADELLQAATPNLTDAERALKDAEGLYASDPLVKPLREKLAAKRQEAKLAAELKEKKQQLDQKVKAAEDGLAATNLNEAEIEGNLKAAEAIYATDARIAPLRQKLKERVAARDAGVKEAARLKRQQELEAAIKNIDGLLTAEDLAKAEAALADAERLFAGETQLASRRQQHEQKKARQQFDKHMAAADAAIAAGDLTKAETALRDAERLLPNDAGISPLRTKLAAAKKAKEPPPVVKTPKVEPKPEPPRDTPKTPRKKRIGEEDVE